MKNNYFIQAGIVEMIERGDAAADISTEKPGHAVDSTLNRFKDGIHSLFMKTWMN